MIICTYHFSILCGGLQLNGQRLLGFPTHLISTYSPWERYIYYGIVKYLQVASYNIPNQPVSSGVKDFVETADSVGLDSKRGNR